MRLIIQLGIIAIAAAIGALLGQQFQGEEGMKLWAFLGGVFALLVTSAWRTGSSGR